MLITSVCWFVDISSYVVCAILVQKKKKKGKGIKQMQCLLLLESFMFRALGKWDKDSANVYNQLGKTMKTGFIVSH